MSSSKKQVLGGKSKQAPANRTVYFEHVMFHITGNNSSFDFTDYNKFERVLESGREITAYYYRTGFTLYRNTSAVTPKDSTYHIATIKKGCKDFDKKLKRIQGAMLNNGKDGTLISF